MCGPGSGLCQHNGGHHGAHLLQRAPSGMADWRQTVRSRLRQNGLHIVGRDECALGQQRACLGRPQNSHAGAWTQPLLKPLAAAGGGVSDEASAMEAAGYAPLLVAGHTHNFKVTYPEDFALAEAVLRQRQMQTS